MNLQMILLISAILGISIALIEGVAIYHMRDNVKTAITLCEKEFELAVSDSKLESATSALDSVRELSNARLEAEKLALAVEARRRADDERFRRTLFATLDAMPEPTCAPGRDVVEATNRELAR